MIKELLTSKFLRNLLTLVTGSLLAQIIPLLFSPLFTRLYSPEKLGTLGLYISIINIGIILVTARYELAIVLPLEDEDAINITVVTFFLILLNSFIITLGLIIFNKPICLLLHNPNFSIWLYFVPIGIILGSGYQVLNYWFTRKKNYKLLSAGVASQGIISNFLYLFLGWINILKSTGLLVGKLMGSFFGFSLLFLRFLKNPQSRHLLKSISIYRIKNNLKRYQNLPRYTLFSQLINTSSTQMVTILLASFFSSNVVGYYSLGFRVILMPLILLGTALGQIFYQEASERQNNFERLRQFALNNYKFLLYLGVIPISIITAFGDHLFVLVFGKNWYMAGKYAQYLSVWMLFVFIGSPLSLLFNVLDQQKKGMIFNTYLFIARLVVLFIGGDILQSSHITIILFGVIGFIFWLAFCCYLLKLVGISYKKSLTISLAPLISTNIILFTLRYMIF